MAISIKIVLKFKHFHAHFRLKVSKNAQFDLQNPSKLWSSKFPENLTQTQVDHCDFIENKIFTKFKHFYGYF